MRFERLQTSQNGHFQAMLKLVFGFLGRFGPVFSDFWPKSGKSGPARCRMRQLWSRHHPPRMEKSVVDSDGTVIFTCGKPDGGSPLTIEFAEKHGKPCLTAVKRAILDVLSRL